MLVQKKKVVLGFLTDSEYGKSFDNVLSSGFVDRLLHVLHKGTEFILGYTHLLDLEVFKHRP